jgi:hypothetical protein
MIKPLNIAQLSSAKPRTGLQSISDLIPRLIQQYELQAELIRAQNNPLSPVVEELHQPGAPRQVTFSWYQ